METLLEQQRRYHEERERLMDAMVQVATNNSDYVQLGFSYLWCYFSFFLSEVDSNNFLKCITVSLHKIRYNFCGRYSIGKSESVLQKSAYGSCAIPLATHLCYLTKTTYISQYCIL